MGTGVYKVLKNQEEMEQKIGASVAVKKILVRNLKKAAAKIPEPELLTNSWQEILEDESIEIVIEVMGGIHPAKEYITQALCAGKHVVTANKDLVASLGGENFWTAPQSITVTFCLKPLWQGEFPLSVPLKQCLAGNHISEVVGIVNGTTNFILTKMTQEHMEFADALALATRLGYAEADPTADIQGYDAGRKVAIMASIAFNSRVTFEDVATEGITHISSKDIRYAKELGCVIKLLGVAKNTRGRH